MKKPYTKPQVESESAFEVLAAGCTLINPADSTGCDPDFGGTPLNTLGGS